VRRALFAQKLGKHARSFVLGCEVTCSIVILASATAAAVHKVDVGGAVLQVVVVLPSFS
jgi:hypothetical protein